VGVEFDAATVSLDTPELPGERLTETGLSEAERTEGAFSDRETVPEKLFTLVKVTSEAEPDP